MNSRISCIITDDEPFARKGLQGYVEKNSCLDLKATCEDALQLSNLLQQQPVDLLFLDIQMPHLTGIELLRSIPNPPKVIFTTAYEQYAVQSFELDVLDYLLKPISYERFMKAVWKAKDYFDLTKQPVKTNTYIFLKTDKKLEKVAFDEILFLEGMENYVAIYFENKKFITHITLKSLFEKLPPELFIQTHKSYIVAINKVDSIYGNTLNVQKNQVPISRNFREIVLSTLVK